MTNPTPRLALTPFDPTFQRDLTRAAQGARRGAAQSDPSPHGWLVTTHDDARILRDKEFWSDPRKATPIRDRPLSARQRSAPSMLFLNDPDHRRLRSLVTASRRKR